MLKTRMSENNLVEEDSVAADLHGSSQERLDRELRNVFLAYAEAPIPPELLDLARRVESTLRARADSADDVATDQMLQGRGADRRRFYH